MTLAPENEKTGSVLKYLQVFSKVKVKRLPKNFAFSYYV